MRTPIVIFVVGTVLSAIVAGVYALIVLIGNGLFPPSGGTG